MTREEYEEESRKLDEECRVEAERHQKAIVSLVDRRIQLNAHEMFLRGSTEWHWGWKEKD